ncbi:hypothetical protein DJ72_14695, partial [Halorubrum distributum]
MCGAGPLTRGVGTAAERRRIGGNRGRPPAYREGTRADEKLDTFGHIVGRATVFREMRRRTVPGISDPTVDVGPVRNSYTYCELFTTMSRSSTPWDEPDPNRRRTALPTDPALDAAD